MPRSCMLLLTIGTAVALGTATATAQEDPERRRDDGQRFAITAADDAFVLVEQNSGRTWLLSHSAEERRGPVWLPIERIDDPESAAEWRQEQQAVARERQQLEREVVERRERERVEQEVDERRQSLEQRGRQLREQVADRTRQMLLEAERELDEKLKQLRDRSRDEPRIQREIERIDSLKETVRQKLEDLLDAPGRDDEDREEPATDHRHDPEREESEVRERRRQLEQQRHERDEATAGRDDVMEMLREVQQRCEKNDSAIRELQERIEQLEQKLRERADRGSTATASPELLELMQEEALLLDTHSRTHPEVQAIRKRIEMTRDLQNKATPQELLPLLVEHELLLETRGPDHPEVRAIQKKIEVTRRFLHEERVDRETVEDQ